MEVRMIRDIDWQKVSEEFKESTPFNHVVIDNFFLSEIAEKLSNEFPDYEGEEIIKYKNALEDKRVLNRWDKFPETTYRTFMYFGLTLSNIMKSLVDNDDLIFDFGLNGGGWHMHSRGGNNNIHLDYSIHPKMKMQRKLNIIVYLSKDWNISWGGGLELWSHDFENNRPKEKIKTVDNIFNRCIIFDTTQNSWHGLPKYIECPENQVRKSIAGYYLIPAKDGVDDRGRALFAPREDQVGNKEVEELIKKRSDVKRSSEVYRK